MTRSSSLASMALLLTLGCGDAPAPNTARSESTAAPPAATTATPPPALPPPAASPVTSAEVTTDEGGRFQFRNLAAGGYRVTFGDPGDRVYTQIDGVQVNATYGANLLDLRLDGSGAAAPLGASEYQPNKLPFVIRGNVVDARDAPIAGVRVRAVRQ